MTYSVERSRPSKKNSCRGRHSKTVVCYTCKSRLPEIEVQVGILTWVTGRLLLNTKSDTWIGPYLTSELVDSGMRKRCKKLCSN